MVLRCSDRISRVPPYLIRPIELPIRGCHPLWLSFPGYSCHSHGSAGPRSLAATRGVSVDFLSSGYLDVSVPRVCSKTPMYSGLKYLVSPTVGRHALNPTKTPKGCPRSARSVATTIKLQVGFPIRRSVGQSLFPAHHSLTQGITSFIASYCLGIHQTPFSRLI